MGIKLAKPKKPVLQATTNEKPKKTENTNKKRNGKLPTDVYHPEFDDTRIEVDDTKQINISVKRGGEMGLPRLDMRIYQTTDLYTGFTKAGFNVPINVLLELLPALQEIKKRCEVKELFVPDDLDSE